MILGIDPGNNTGWAIVNEKAALISCGLGEPPVGKYSLVVIEKPQVYPSTTAKQANDLISVAWCAARLHERHSTNKVLVVIPHDWKGSTPKDIHNNRVLRSLTDAERRLVPVRPRSKEPIHDVVDAIGLARFGLGIRY